MIAMLHITNVSKMDTHRLQEITLGTHQMAIPLTNSKYGIASRSISRGRSLTVERVPLYLGFWNLVQICHRMTKLKMPEVTNSKQRTRHHF